MKQAFQRCKITGSGGVCCTSYISSWLRLTRQLRITASHFSLKAVQTLTVLNLDSRFSLYAQFTIITIKFHYCNPSLKRLDRDLEWIRTRTILTCNCLLHLQSSHHKVTIYSCASLTNGDFLPLQSLFTAVYQTTLLSVTMYPSTLS